MRSSDMYVSPWLQFSGSSGEQKEVETPPAPQDLTATVNEAGSVVLTWNDPNDASITGYRILRRNRDTSQIGVFTVINDDTVSAATMYVDDTVEPATRYTYRIKAINPGGLSPQSHYIRVDTPAVEPEANSPATGQPAVSGTARVGEILTTETSAIEDEDGLTNASFSYQWVAGGSDIDGAADSGYTLTSNEVGQTIQVRVSFTDDAGKEETVTSAATGAVAPKPNRPATGQPTIVGVPQVGETLTAETSGITDEDGLENAEFAYQWIAGDGTTDTGIPGATEATYALTADDEGNTIKVRVSFTDDAGNGETLTSQPTVAVTALEPEPQDPPAQPTGLTGTVEHDFVSLTWDDPGDDSITGYQILRRDPALHEIGVFLVHADDTGSGATEYVDRDVVPETQYNYRIKAAKRRGSERAQRLLQSGYPAGAGTRTGTQLSGHGRARHHRHGTGGGDAAGGRIGHRRR